VSNESKKEDTYPNAGRDSGYVAPVGEDIVNTLTILLSTLETKLLTSNITLKSEIANQGDIRRNQFNELQHLIDSRYDGLANELDRFEAGQAGIRTLVEESVTDIKKEIGDMGAVLTATVGRVSNVEEAVNEHGAQLVAHEHAIQETRAEVDTMQTEIAVLQTGLRDIRTKLAGLEAESRLFQQFLAANPQPDALKKNARG
jgi:chromosome segregation ATPase